MECLLFSDFCKFPHVIQPSFKCFLICEIFTNVMSPYQHLPHLTFHCTKWSDIILVSNLVTFGYRSQSLPVIMKPRLFSLQQVYLVAKPDLGNEKPSFYSSAQDEYLYILLQIYGCVWLCSATQNYTVMLNDILHMYIFSSKTSKVIFSNPQWSGII